jgi:Flp pilus assembly pilin Flp
MEQVRQSLPGQRAIAARRLAGEEGQGLVEYSLVLLFVAVAIVGALVSFHGGLSSEYTSIVSIFPSA